MKPFFTYTREQRMGLLCLFFLILGIQLFIVFFNFETKHTTSIAEKKWLAQQVFITNSLEKSKDKSEFKIYPFNPNYITDYKGYQLGMSVEEIDRLMTFRKSGQFINSKQDFQAVTKVSNTVLNKIAPYFKFPQWVIDKQNNTHNRKEKSNNLSFEKHTPKKVEIKDINFATKEELMKLYGIGEVLSERILNHRNSLGGYVAIDQIDDIWGLSDEVKQEIYKNFKILSPPKILTSNVNKASTKELSKIPYLKYNIAREIVIYRSMHGNITNKEELLKIKNFPIEKLKIISLYLEF